MLLKPHVSVFDDRLGLKRFAEYHSTHVFEVAETTVICWPSLICELLLRSSGFFRTLCVICLTPIVEYTHISWRSLPIRNCTEPEGPSRYLGFFRTLRAISYYMSVAWRSLPIRNCTEPEGPSCTRGSFGRLASRDITPMKFTRDIPDQNSGMGGYGFIPAPRKMNIRWTGNTHPFHKSRVVLLGMGFGY